MQGREMSKATIRINKECKHDNWYFDNHAAFTYERLNYIYVRVNSTAMGR